MKFVFFILSLNLNYSNIQANIGGIFEIEKYHDFAYNDRIIIGKCISFKMICLSICHRNSQCYFVTKKNGIYHYYNKIAIFNKFFATGSVIFKKQPEIK